MIAECDTAGAHVVEGGGGELDLCGTHTHTNTHTHDCLLSELCSYTHASRRHDYCIRGVFNMYSSCTELEKGLSESSVSKLVSMRHGLWMCFFPHVIMVVSMPGVRTIVCNTSCM